MPKRFTKKSPKRYQKRRPKTASLYHANNARSLQIATRRNINMKLKFVLNQTYIYNSGETADGKSAVIKYSANSVFHSHVASSETLGEFKSQNPTLYDNTIANGINQNAQGFTRWSESYRHFTCTGSKISIVVRPMGTGIPTQVSVVLVGTSTAVTKDTTSAQINTMPFLRRAIICSTGSGNTNSVRLYTTYSARKFEAVKDPQDSFQLRGRCQDLTVTPPFTGQAPTESSYFYVVLSPVDPNATGKMPPFMITTKVEYITLLREPTETNHIQLRQLPEMGGGANFGFMSQL